MINPGLQKYEVVLADRYFLRELVEVITLEDSLSEIAQRANVKLAFTSDFPGIAPGQKMRVSGVPFDGTEMDYLLHPGVVWEVSSSNRGQKHLSVTVYDDTIYLSKSEEEYLFPEGQTATQRLQVYAADWDIRLGEVADTGIPLAKGLRRAQSIWKTIMDDLKETVKKGGAMYRPRMTADGLSLVKLGSNNTVWVLENDQNVEEVDQQRTLEGTITRVKVLGNASAEERSPVLALVSGDTSVLGTLQKIINDSKITTASEAEKAGNELLSGIQETVTVQGIDINTLRAGEKIQYNGNDYLIISVRHELGSPGHMILELAEESQVRRRYYSQSF